MNKKTIAALMVAGLSMFAFAVVPTTQAITDPGGERFQEAYLIAGQYTICGVLIMHQVGTTLYITYDLDEGWKMKESHLAVAGSLDAVPQKNDNPTPGHFAFGDAYKGGATEDMFTIDLTTFEHGSTLYIAAHADVGKETVWGQGEAFAGNNWAMYITFALA